MNQPEQVVVNAGARLGFVCLKVSDLDQSLRFYSEQLGMVQRRRLRPSTALTEVLLDSGDPAQPGLMLIHDAARTSPYLAGDAFSRLILYVDDLPGLLPRLKAEGLEILREPTVVEVLNICIMLVRDPDGYVLELIERA